MGRHLEREIELLKKLILSLAAMVEDAVRKAVSAVNNGDEKLAQSVISTDIEINEREVELEEECLKILALHQPVAVDMRYIVAVLKMNSDLERIGDLAVNIAERAKYLAKNPPPKTGMDFSVMMDNVQDMLKACIDALVRKDISIARKVLASDDIVDQLNRQMYITIQMEIKKDVNNLEPLIHLLSVSRHLERIADHATNIAEDIIYMIEGEIIRHKAEEFTTNLRDGSQKK